MTFNYFSNYIFLPEAEHAVSRVIEGPHKPSPNDIPLESMYFVFLKKVRGVESVEFVLYSNFLKKN